MALHVMDEANRCLQCKNPQCVKGCPIKTPIPEVIRLLKENSLDEAGKSFLRIILSLPFAVLYAIMKSNVRDTVYLEKKGVAVHFSTIEQYISRTYAPRMVQGPAPTNGMRVAIIGSGPAGITIAIILARYGYKVTIFENKSEIGGVLRYGIPDFRLPKAVLDDIQYRHIEMKGIKVRPNAHIGGSIGIEDLFRDGYKAIFVGTGVWKPNALHIKGETLGHVHFGINYLNSPESFKLGQRVIVIGAGNAAMDVARTALRHGTEYLTCFSITKEVAASQYEFTYAKLEGVRFEYSKRPVEIVDEGVIFCDVVQNEDGSFTDVEGTERLYEADSVIVSISQGPQNVIVKSTTGLATNDNGLLIADEYGNTSRAGIFSSGDVVHGPRTVVEAVAHSKVVAETMHKYMQSLKD